MFDSIKGRHAAWCVWRYDDNGRLYCAKAAWVGGVWGWREVLVVEHHGRGWRRDGGIDGIVVPSNPEAIETAFLAVAPVREARQGEPHITQHARRHIPHKRLEIDHACNGKGYERAQHLAAFLGDHVLLDPCLRAVAQRELFGELAVVVAEAALGDGVGVRGGPQQRSGRLSLQSQPVLVGEAVVAHDQRGQAVGEGIHARPRLVVGAFVRPYNVEARVDAGYRQSVEGRVAETQRCEVVCVWKLAGWVLACAGAGARPTHLVDDFFENVHGQVQQVQRALCSLLFALGCSRRLLGGWRRMRIRSGGRRGTRPHTVGQSLHGGRMRVVVGG